MNLKIFWIALKLHYVPGSNPECRNILELCFFNYDTPTFAGMTLCATNYDTVYKLGGPLGQVLYDLFESSGKLLRHWLITRVSAQIDRSLEGFQARLAANAFFGVPFNVPARQLIQFIVDVFGQFFKH